MDCSPPGDYAHQDEASTTSKLLDGARSVISLYLTLDKLLALSPQLGTHELAAMASVKNIRTSAKKLTHIDIQQCPCSKQSHEFP